MYVRLTPHLTLATASLSILFNTCIIILKTRSFTLVSMPEFPARPPTPQVLIHRLPDKVEDESRVPTKYIVLITGSILATGKMQIAQSVAKALSCPFFAGDSLHDSSAKAANVGATRAALGEDGQPNKAIYQRMWLSKLPRTGYLFPNESRPAGEGFSGFGGNSSTSTSRRGSASSIGSVSSSIGTSSNVSSSRVEQAAPGLSTWSAGMYATRPRPTVQNTVFTVPESELRRRANPALLVVTHPPLYSWHRYAIRNAVEDYKIGVIFVPLEESNDDDEDDLPTLQPLDPTKLTSFPTSFGSFGSKPEVTGSLDREMRLDICVDADVEGKIDEIVNGASQIMGVKLASD